MRVPYTNFKSAVSGQIKDIDTPEIFDDKKIIVFAVPGAFTDSSKQHLQEFEDKYNDFKTAGITEIYCVSVNDSFVMNAWFKELCIQNVKPLADGEAVFTQGMGMLVNKPKQGFGMRSWRYSMFVVNAEVKQQFIEPGPNHAGDDEDPFGLSSAENMLQFVKGKNI